MITKIFEVQPIFSCGTYEVNNSAVYSVTKLETKFAAEEFMLHSVSKDYDVFSEFMITEMSHTVQRTFFAAPENDKVISLLFDYMRIAFDNLKSGTRIVFIQGEPGAYILEPDQVENIKEGEEINDLQVTQS